MSAQYLTCGGFAGSRSKFEKGSWGMARYLIKSDPITGYRNDGSTLTSGQRSKQNYHLEESSEVSPRPRSCPRWSAAKIIETFAFRPRFSTMEYRCIEFFIVQSIERGRWKWSVAAADLGNRSGLACSRDAAAADARKAISWLLAAKKRQVENV